MNSPCCSPQREPRSPTTNRPSPTDGSFASVPGSDAVEIPEGSFRMGTDDERFPADREGPVRSVDVPAFAIGRAPVTNAEFATFVETTGLVTLAESDGWTFVFGGLLPDDFPPTRGVAGAEWWRAVEGADWRHPQGPDTSLEGLMQHPVVHVAFEDALAYADWAGKRLPTADEWEVAARGGLVDQDYAWGSEKTPDGRWLANVWQGPFPWDNKETDGWFWTSPVGSFPANGYGLVDVCGNVWEWTSTPYAVPEGEQERRVIKGGSFLCADNYCHRFRPSALMGQTLDTATCHMGFRCAADC